MSLFCKIGRKSHKAFRKHANFLSGTASFWQCVIIMLMLSLSVAGIGQDYDALNSNEYLEFFRVGTAPSEIVQFDNMTGKKLFILKDGSVQTFWSGTLAPGATLRCRGFHVPTDPSGQWEFNLALTPEPTPIDFEWTDAQGKSGLVQFILAWKKTPPTFRVKIREKGGEEKSVFSGVRDGFVIPPFVMLQVGEEPIDEFYSSQWEKYPRFKVLFPDVEENETGEWELNLIGPAKEGLANQKGKGVPPESILLSEFESKLIEGTHYYYQFTIKREKGGTRASALREFTYKSAPHHYYFKPQLRLSTTSIIARDTVTDAGAVMSSSLSPGVGGTFHLLIHKIETSLQIAVDKIEIPAQSGRPIAQGSPYYLNVTAGAKYHLTDSLGLGLMLGGKHLPFFRATSETNLVIDRILVPQVQLMGHYRLLDRQSSDLSVIASMGMLLSKTTTAYQVGSGFEVTARLQGRSRVLGHVGYLDLGVGYIDQNSTIAEQSLYQLFLQLGVLF